MLRHVFQDALVVVGPELLEQRTFGRDVLVGIQDQHFGLGLVLFEVMRHLAGTLVRAGRAAVGRFWNGDGVNAAVVHRFQLLAQGQGFWAAFPRLQNLTRGAGFFQTFDGVEHQVDAG